MSHCKILYVCQEITPYLPESDMSVLCRALSQGDVYKRQGVNHPQITYYFLFILAAFWINELVSAARAKALPRFAKTTGLLALAAVLAVGSNAGMLYYINSHSAEKMCIRDRR